ncbi:UDP-galactose transporter [Abortiporus biennis]
MLQHKDYGNAHHSLHLNLKQEDAYEKEELGGIVGEPQNAVPSVCGMPLKYVSLVTLAVQNAMLTLIMHYSRVSAAPSETYSAASAVLMTELLKGSISLCVAFTRLDSYSPQYLPNSGGAFTCASLFNPRLLFSRFRRLGKEVFRSDCWKLSIPAILYVIQNNLQFVAVSNLEAATFQVSYQMKILTTAGFSVLLLRKKLSPTKWLALLFLAIGVGIVQIQTGSAKAVTINHEMNAFKGFMAVVMACFTSGLAGVYFEMVLKNSQGDLWVRNVQLSLFSLLPALVPVLFSNTNSSGNLFSTNLFANFGVWAWATVLTQVLGGLLTALVIKYADNILKGFATSLSIVISFLASVALFNFHMTLTFILGSTVVLVATWMYNQPDTSSSVEVGSGIHSRSWSWHWRRNNGVNATHSVSSVELAPGGTLSRRASTSSLSSISSFTASHSPSKSYPSSPIERDQPKLGLLDKNVLAKKLEQTRVFGIIPLKKAIASRVALFRSASFTSSTSEPTFAYHHVPGYVSQPNPSYPPRPSSSLSSYPSTRPPSALSGSSSMLTLSEASSSNSNSSS